MNANELLMKGNYILKNNLFNKTTLDCELILANIMGISRENLLINNHIKINKCQEKKFNAQIKERKLRKPTAYLIGKKEFYKTNFIINKSVLIPRPDTEVIIENVLKLYSKNEEIKVLDIGTGSGCILITLLLERKKFRGIGIDISKEAINIANINAKMQQLRNRIRFYNTDVDNFFSYKYDLIVSNPPYINKFKISSLIEDVKDFEPLLALDGGPDGYEVILKVIKKSSKLLKKNGKLIIEIDNTQVKKIVNMLLKYNFFTNKICKDLNGLNRCVVATKL